MDDEQSTMSAMSNGTAKLIGGAHLDDLPRAPLLSSHTASVASQMTSDRRAVASLCKFRNLPVANRALGPLGLRVVGGTPTTALFTDRSVLWDGPGQRAQRPHAAPAAPALAAKLLPAWTADAADDTATGDGGGGAADHETATIDGNASAVTGATSATGASFVSSSLRLPREPLLHLTHNKVPRGADYARSYCLSCAFEEVTARALTWSVCALELISTALSAARELSRPPLSSRACRVARLGRIPSSRSHIESTRHPPPPSGDRRAAAAAAAAQVQVCAFCFKNKLTKQHRVPIERLAAMLLHQQPGLAPLKLVQVGGV